MKKIARVFPRKTKASPDDKLCFFGPPDLFTPNVDEVHISVTFTYDLPKVEFLEKQWSRLAPTKVGGPAFCKPGGEFTPGMYLKQGYVITSRGCPNHCWFCSVWKREPKLVELEIKNGWNILDDNLLACSEEHIQKVFKMLGQHKGKVEFTGGLEAKLLKPWHTEEIRKLKTKQMFFAYDTEDDLDPLIEAGKLLKKVGYDLKTNHSCRCYVLIGFPKDTIEKAEVRLNQTIQAGFAPIAMLWKNEKGESQKVWRQFQRTWANPTILFSKIKIFLDNQTERY